MDKHQVVLIQIQPLLGEGLQRIIQKFEDFELLSLPFTNWQKLDARLKDINPDMVLLAGEKEDDQTTHLISNLLKRYENIPIVWVDLETTKIRFFTSHSLTANSAELINAIRESEWKNDEIHSLDIEKNIKD
jgi:chemotaxis response regulator CheB